MKWTDGYTSEYACKLYNDRMTNWHKWFAWYPVVVDIVDNHKVYAWLEVVERKGEWHPGVYEIPGYWLFDYRTGSNP